MAEKPLADLSLDLDNKWSYMKTHGDEGWETFPSYLDVVIPQVIAILRRHELSITVFVVGQDAVIEQNQPALRSLVDAGHEIGNHSFNHEPWMQRYSPEQLREEFDRAEQALATICSRRPRGFRGPGYCLSPEILELLNQRGYLFDASTLPTFLGPIARAYYFLKSDLSKSQAEDRSQLFGSWKDGLRPLRPYRWRTSQGELLEIPVTTMPIVRAPFHFSYLLYLAQYSELLAAKYFELALALCRFFRLGPSLLLHPLDFVGGDEVSGLDFFPAMNLAGERKRDFLSRMLGIYCRSFEVLPMGERAERLSAQSSAVVPLLPKLQAET